MTNNGYHSRLLEMLYKFSDARNALRIMVYVLLAQCFKSQFNVRKDLVTSAPTAIEVNSVYSTNNSTREFFDSIHILRRGEMQQMNPFFSWTRYHSRWSTFTKRRSPYGRATKAKADRIQTFFHCGVDFAGPL